MTQITQAKYQDLLNAIALKKDGSTNINVRELLEANDYGPLLENIAVLTIKTPVTLTLDGLTIKNCRIMEGLEQTTIISNCEVTDSKFRLTSAEGITNSALTRCNGALNPALLNQLKSDGNKSEDSIFLPVETAFAQSWFADRYPKYLSDSAGFCNGVCFEYTRRHNKAMAHSQDQNVTQKMLDTLTSPKPQNCLKRISNYQKYFQMDTDDKVLIFNFDKAFDINPVLAERLKEASVIGVALPTKNSGHMICIKRCVNEDGSEGYRIFDPNFGESAIFDSKELNIQFNALKSFYCPSLSLLEFKFLNLSNIVQEMNINSGISKNLFWLIEALLQNDQETISEFVRQDINLTASDVHLVGLEKLIQDPAIKIENLAKVFLKKDINPVVLKSLFIRAIEEKNQAVIAGCTQMIEGFNSAKSLQILSCLYNKGFAKLPWKSIKSLSEKVDTLPPELLCKVVDRAVQAGDQEALQACAKVTLQYDPDQCNTFLESLGSTPEWSVLEASYARVDKARLEYDVKAKIIQSMLSSKTPPFEEAKALIYDTADPRLFCSILRNKEIPATHLVPMVELAGRFNDTATQNAVDKFIGKICRERDASDLKELSGLIPDDAPNGFF